MTRDEYRKAIDGVIYLCICAVNGKMPDKERTASLNPEHLYKAANKHNLSAIVGNMLELAGISDHAFIQARAKAIRKVTVMEMDKELLFQHFEQEKIWYMPLKGCVIKDLYPSVGMRQMSDFDVLFDSTYREKVRDIFIELGFTSESYARGNHDVYFKKPVSNFEMHTALFNENNKKELYEYYLSIKPLMLKDDSNKYGYHLGINDFYVYITAHEYKHYTGSGTGLRSLLDTYVIWQKHSKELDADYIRTQTDKLGITDFEQKNKMLSIALFGGKELSPEENKMLEYIIFSGTYGNVSNRVENQVEKFGGGKKGRLKYIISRLLLPMNEVKAYHPFFYRHKILLPGLFFYRLGRAATVSRNKTKKQLRSLKKTKGR